MHHRPAAAAVIKTKEAPTVTKKQAVTPLHRAVRTNDTRVPDSVLSLRVT